MNDGSKTWAFVMVTAALFGGGMAIATTNQQYLDPRGAIVQPQTTAVHPPDLADQTISTVLQDPEHPDEPWEVISLKRDGESSHAFVRRHRELVEAVRDELNP